MHHYYCYCKHFNVLSCTAMSILGMMIASTGLFDSCAICKRTVRSVVGNIWCFGGGGEPRIGIPVRFTSPSFTRRQWVLNQMYNVMRRPAWGWLAVVFDTVSVVHSA